jgi:hypothetical protein
LASHLNRGQLAQTAEAGFTRRVDFLLHERATSGMENWAICSRRKETSAGMLASQAESQTRFRAGRPIRDDRTVQRRQPEILRLAHRDRLNDPALRAGGGELCLAQNPLPERLAAIGATCAHGASDQGESLRTLSRAGGAMRDFISGRRWRLIG